MIKTNQSGRSMVEMLGVLAIIGVLSVGGIAGYSKAMNKYKINKTTDQISMLVANIRTMFATQGNYNGLTNGSAIKYGLVPNEMYETSDNGSYSGSYTITNAFGGKVTIKSSKLNDGSTTGAFTLQYDNLTQEACVTIVSGDWGSAQGSGLLAIGAAAGSGTGKEAKAAEINLDGIYPGAEGSASGAGGSSAYGAPGGKTVDTPIDVAIASSWCSDSGSNNSVAWKYY